MSDRVSQGLRPLTVYIDAGVNDAKVPTRTIAFDVPPDVSQAELIEWRYAIDGDQAVHEVQAYVDEDGDFCPLHQVLHREQMWLMELLAEKGYAVTFR